MGNSNMAVMNFTVQSKGTQFDRLAIMYFGDSEVFRTSTAEPRKNGIIWTYEKDMSEYMYFWKSPQKVIFDLPNQTTANLTGTFNTTLTATFFSAPSSPLPQNTPADLILPISLQTGSNSSSAPSVFVLPSATHNASVPLTLPRNTNRAILSLSTTGQASEEFWWSNVLSSDILAFNSTGGPLLGSSPFREVQVLIDGQLAGVQWPFPVIFTGGVVPSLWSPVVGIDAFDLREYEIDVSPWLGVLCDGKEHVFSIKVMGLSDDGGTRGEIADNVGSNWMVTGKVFIWKDADVNAVTTGAAPTLTLSPPTIQVSQTLGMNSTGGNETLGYFVSVQRSLSVTGSITTQKYGANKETKWSQSLSHTDNGTYLQSGFQQLNTITTTGSDTSTGAVPYAYTYTYPLLANVSAVVTPTDGNTTITGTITRSKNSTLSPPNSSVHPSGIESFASNSKSGQLVANLQTFNVNTTQSGTAFLFQSPSKGISTGVGDSWTEMRVGGVSKSGVLGEDTELWYRRVVTRNGSVVGDGGRVVGQAFGDSVGTQVSSDLGGVGVSGMQMVLGPAEDVGGGVLPKGSLVDYS
ncbi:peptide N-acetyl-beta-D-glucosaminyl asparaginase amidase A-domain-containing protein [Halenospora varia]|nr:peptide N-acetyl-beta-D-glucosaminyl asparaginase amidase A-domain-containing protein [Halenospora varia]